MVSSKDMRHRVGLGQDSHGFLPPDSTKPCVIAGVIFEDVPGFRANSDGDVVFHAICNALSSLTGEIILGKVADKLLETKGITDSAVYLQEALKTLKGEKVVHVALSLEGARPHFLHRFEEMRETIAREMGIEPSQVGITATTGERLTSFGCGEGVQCLCVLTVSDDEVA